MIGFEGADAHDHAAARRQFPRYQALPTHVNSVAEISTGRLAEQSRGGACRRTLPSDRVHVRPALLEAEPGTGAGGRDPRASYEGDDLSSHSTHSTCRRPGRDRPDTARSFPEPGKPAPDNRQAAPDGQPTRYLLMPIRLGG
jgi:hypothetical protein